MSWPRLSTAFTEALAAQGISLPADKVAFSTDFVRLLVGTCVRSVDQFATHAKAIHAVTSRRCPIPAGAVRLLLGLAQSPSFRAVPDGPEVRTFVARFGEAAGKALAEATAGEVGLDEYATRYGSSEALLLMDAMFTVAASDGTIDGDELRRLQAAAAELGIDAVLFAALYRRHDPREAAGGLRFTLKGERVRIGRAAGSEVMLPDPQVGLLHAELVRGESGWRIVDAESGRPTVLNGRPVTSAPVSPSDELQVGPYTLRLDPDGEGLSVSGARAFTALSARDLTRRIGEVSLLDQVSFTVFSGEVIAMVGPSGAGKTTLLNAIAGVAPADSGAVELDGKDFHSLLRLDRSRVGIVPQDDIVLPELTVEESLFFSGKLRFGADTDDAAVHAEVDRVLDELGIPHIRHSRIGDALRRGISGGQRKRVNLGQELLTRSTRVLFLDEPTSGLDPRAAQDIVRLVRQLADRGRIVFLVTHDLSPQVMAQVDHLLVLAPGGRVAWFGPPKDACRYFRVPTPDAIFNRFSEKAPAEWGVAWRESPDFRTFVRTREELLDLGADEGGQSLHEPVGLASPRPTPPGEAGAPAPAEPAAVRHSALSQLSALTRRYWRVKLRDRTGLFVLGLQPPFLALVMWLVFPEPTSSMMFMLTLSCLWFGMSAAVRELISDRVVWMRERRVGVGVLPYLGSKVAVLALLVTLQCMCLAGLDWVAFGLGDLGFGLFRLLGVASITGVTGMALGLLMSALFLSSEAAVGTLPLLLIPQISFSSLLVSLRLMPAAAYALSWLNPLRYAFDAMMKVATWREDGVSQFGKIAVPPRYGTKWEDPQTITGQLYDLGLKPESADDIGLTPAVLVAALLAFNLVFLSAAALRTHSRKE